jgi:hypothetical protein
MKDDDKRNKSGWLTGAALRQGYKEEWAKEGNNGSKREVTLHHDPQRDRYVVTILTTNPPTDIKKAEHDFGYLSSARSRFRLETNA